MSSLTEVILIVPVVLIAVTFHEFAHGYTAYLLGDPTPKNQGRLTLNPIPHIDPLGALMLVIAHFGWAKPVEINPYYFKGNRQKGLLLVSLAGPLSNIFLAIIGLVFLEFLPQRGYFSLFSYLFVLININLAAFNLLPIPPLDGSKILAGLVPPTKLSFLYSLEQYGPLIMILFLVTGFFRVVLNPIVLVLKEFIVLPIGSGLIKIIYLVLGVL